MPVVLGPAGLDSLAGVDARVAAEKAGRDRIGGELGECRKYCPGRVLLC